jgi:hypothetical protein
LVDVTGVVKHGGVSRTARHISATGSPRQYRSRMRQKEIRTNPLLFRDSGFGNSGIAARSGSAIISAIVVSFTLEGIEGLCESGIRIPGLAIAAQPWVARFLDPRTPGGVAGPRPFPNGRSLFFAVFP